MRLIVSLRNSQTLAIDLHPSAMIIIQPSIDVNFHQRMPLDVPHSKDPENLQEVFALKQGSFVTENEHDACSIEFETLLPSKRTHTPEYIS